MDYICTITPNLEANSCKYGYAKTRIFVLFSPCCHWPPAYNAVAAIDRSHWSLRVSGPGCSAAHYLNQCWLTIRPLGSIFQLNSIWNSKVFFHKNAYEKVICINGGHIVSASRHESSPDDMHLPISSARRSDLIIFNKWPHKHAFIWFVSVDVLVDLSFWIYLF